MKIIYTKSFCPNCNYLKNIFKAEGTEYIEKSIELEENRDYLIRKGVLSLPYTEDLPDNE